MTVKEQKKAIRELPALELKSESDKLEAKIWKMRFQARGEPVENCGQLKHLKKERARMLTILQQMKAAGSDEAKAEAVSSEAAGENSKTKE